MHVDVKLFAILRERAGRDRVGIELREGSSVGDALDELRREPALGELIERMPVTMAVNREYAAADTPLAEGDELALIPPVSGGDAATGQVHARVRSEPLSLDRIAAAVVRPGAGAVVSFQGVTREVDRLDYEAYEEMASERIEAILAEVVAAPRARGRRRGAPRRSGPARRAERHRGRLGRASRGGLRRRPRGDRPDQGGGADLEARDRRRGGEMGGGDEAGSEGVKGLTHLDAEGAARMVDVGGSRRASGERSPRRSSGCGPRPPAPSPPATGRRET